MSPRAAGGKLLPGAPRRRERADGRHGHRPNWRVLLLEVLLLHQLLTVVSIRALTMDWGFLPGGLLLLRSLELGLLLWLLQLL